MGGTEVVPVRVMHGRLPIVGYRVGRFAYLTDLSTLPEEEVSRLEGLDCLVVTDLQNTPERLFRRYRGVHAARPEEEKA